MRRLAVTVVDEEADRRLRRANIEALLERRALRRQVEREEARSEAAARAPRPPPSLAGFSVFSGSSRRWA